MTPEPVTITEDTPVEVIARIMESRRIRRLPVLSGDKIVGIVTNSDFLPAIASRHCRPLRGRNRRNGRESSVFS